VQRYNSCWIKDAVKIKKNAKKYRCGKEKAAKSERKGG